MPADEEQWVPDAVRGRQPRDQESGVHSSRSDWLPPGMERDKPEEAGRTEDPAPHEAGLSRAAKDRGRVDEEAPTAVNADGPAGRGHGPTGVDPSIVIDELKRVHELERGALEGRLAAAEAAAREAEDARHQAQRANEAELVRLASEAEGLRAKLYEAEEALAEQREQAERTVEQAATEAAAYNARIAEMQEELERLDDATRLANERVIAATSGGNRDEAGRLELNTITVEGLRRLGLSLTQAARVVRHREALGAFRSAEDLAAIPGFSHEQRADLADRIYIDTSLAGRQDV